MGTQIEVFKCPHCEAQMTRTASPNFTAVGGPGPVSGAVIVLSCPSCQKVIGTYFMPPTV
jgi:endogenous inhibitor of DNA gyrase (YacG/DUF329 family)